ncbi:MAG TPA: symmetrical bis(5'-nucleosyl)-tetraphosphatase [Burkholderiaceae bacterium]|nr:symmetrical bis(5'-nucleosyl)-tetraphosphatase [Burkholderiaceae bacterium]
MILAIGDIQGCLAPLQDLLARAPPSSKVVLVGDIVNRGPQSLETLRFVRSLGDRVTVVLGNHDLHLLAVACGIRRLHADDTIDEILQAPDRDELIDWVRARPLAWREAGALFVHAGLLPPWTAARALELATEVEQQLRGRRYREFLATMYGNEPSRWSDALRGAERARCIINALTRLRLVDADGAMNLALKEGLDAAPPGWMPWFDHPRRASRGTPIVFGHWAALGLMVRDDAVGLDSGCVWGRCLTGMTWPDRAIFQVSCGGIRDA